MKKVYTWALTLLLFSFPLVASAQSDAITGVFLSGIFGLFGLIWIAWFMFILIFVAAIFSLIIFWIFMIVDVLKRDFEKEDEKTMWMLVVFLASWLGSIVYYVMIKSKDKKQIKK